MECPVCNFSELSEDAVLCSQCQSDLEVFHHLEDARSQHSFHKKIIAGLAILLAIVALGWGTTRFLSGEKPKENVQLSIAENDTAQAPAADNSAEYAQLKKENETLTAEVSSLKATINSLNEKLNTKEKGISGETLTHTVKEGESLWRIALKYYKDGYQYKKIADENGISNPGSIRAGMELKISKH